MGNNWISKGDAKTVKAVEHFAILKINTYYTTQ